MLYKFLRNLLFYFEPEWIHEKILKKIQKLGFNILKTIFVQPIKKAPIYCMGLIFKNPLGLAAGLDKNGEFIDLFAAMGFGYIEIGTVTPNPQLGNKKPRFFRIIEAEAFINRIGFYNVGVDNVIENIKKTQFKGILGINISKNKETPIEKSEDDYLICLKKLYFYASYIVINISSPNTPKLRNLQYGEMLNNLLKIIKKEQRILSKIYNKYVPILIKISPDLSEIELIKIADSLLSHKIDGIIATNTTIKRDLVMNLPYFHEIGGLSGKPLHYRSTEVIRILSKELQNRIPIIGVGGINCLISAREKMVAGAKLLQIYSGLIYQGPSLITKIINYI
ncbi:MAG: quinone-dependent dihydroorotate dehydrogenase [Candidatus Dasytiphilus stammeri]